MRLLEQVGADQLRVAASSERDLRGFVRDIAILRGIGTRRGGGSGGRGPEHTRRRPPMARAPGPPRSSAPAATMNSPTMTWAASPAAHASRRVHDQPVLQRPVAQLDRDERLVAVGRRRRPGRRAGRSTVEPYAVEHGQADGHADHPGDGHGRRRGPEGRRPAASTAAVERGVTVNPKPRPNNARGGHRRQGRRSRSSRPSRRGPGARRPARRARRAAAAGTGREPRRRAHRRRRAGERAERDLLLVRAAVQDPVDEHARHRRSRSRTRSR